MSFYPFDTADRAKLDEILREAESLLAAQNTLAIAADQRAMTFSGLLAAAVAALISAAVALGASASMIARPLTLLAAALLVALILALVSARPTNWQVAGNDPANWEEDLTQAVPDTMEICLAAMAFYYRSSIARNARAIRYAGWLMTASMVVTVAALAAATIWQVTTVF